MALLAISCSKVITVCIINHSDTAISIDNHGKQLRCEPGQIISFIPELQDDHDIAVRLGSESLFYKLTNTPSSFLDIKHDKRLLFVFGKDRKLYLLKPTDKPLDEDIGFQPAGYPLIPQ
ncbi:MAG TPA: hypothetical protein VK769_07440 [Verrucomicrobiae bacterium]|nr:hypothetical protein [Verrucomicrobiae bacterium]